MYFLFFSINLLGTTVTAGIQLIVLLQYKSRRFIQSGPPSAETVLYTKSGDVEQFLQVIAQINVQPLDRVFRYLAPIIYAAFCIVYFGYYFYLGKKE